MGKFFSISLSVAILALSWIQHWLIKNVFVVVAYSFKFLFHRFIRWKIVCCQWQLATFDQAVMVNSSYNPEYYDMSMLRVSKYNRTTYVLNMQCEYFVDLADEYFLEIQFFTAEWITINLWNLRFVCQNLRFADFLKMCTWIGLQMT